MELLRRQAHSQGAGSTTPPPPAEAAEDAGQVAGAPRSVCGPSQTGVLSKAPLHYTILTEWPQVWI